MAFTRDGRRLGKGGGYYDRFLANLQPRPYCIGVTFAALLLEQIPMEEHDIKMDQVVSDQEATAEN
jgi:5-formyltetrahydrofolate cyclo-ligase